MTSAAASSAITSSAIALYARETAGFDDRVAQAADRLRAAAERHAGRIVQSSSLGAEDMVVTDLIARAGLSIPVATLGTGVLHAETEALLPRILARYGIAVEVYTPRPESVLTFVRQHGPRAMYDSIALRKGCCAMRKLEPLQRLLAGRDAWLTGLRREQSSNRAEVPFEEADDAGRVKLNPLADWRWQDVWHYIATHDVPYNPLHDAFMPSIGCAPCTRAIAVGEDFRAGRWWWEDETMKECGLHVHDASAVAPAAVRADVAAPAATLPVDA